MAMCFEAFSRLWNLDFQFVCVVSVSISNKAVIISSLPII